MLLRYWTLGEVVKLLEVTPRQVQYLREIAVVTPARPATRGGNCLYSKQNVVLLYLALKVFTGWAVEVKRKALHAYCFASDSTIAVAMGSGVTLLIDKTELTATVDQLLSP